MGEISLNTLKSVKTTKIPLIYANLTKNPKFSKIFETLDIPKVSGEIMVPMIIKITIKELIGKIIKKCSSTDIFFTQ